LLLCKPLKNLEILIKPWGIASKDAFLIRKKVFVQEQGVPEEMEIDEYDELAWHALVYQDQQAIATGRLVALGKSRGQIGRMAVMPDFRGQGIGTDILKCLIELAQQQKMGNLVLHSQITVIPFYEKLGFVAEGPIYDEAGIAHRNMMLILPT
jgi:predicted GNAT family N-acyltransferase